MPRGGHGGSLRLDVWKGRVSPSTGSPQLRPGQASVGEAEVGPPKVWITGRDKQQESESAQTPGQPSLSSRILPDQPRGCQLPPHPRSLRDTSPGGSGTTVWLPPECPWAWAQSPLRARLSDRAGPRLASLSLRTEVTAGAQATVDTMQ